MLVKESQRSNGSRLQLTLLSPWGSGEGRGEEREGGRLTPPVLTQTHATR